MPQADTVVEVDHVSKRFVLRQDKSLKERLVNFGRSNQHKQDFMALNDVSLTIEAGTTIGLIGPNGSGKSTLLKTIGGIIQPSSGTVRRRGRMAALLELGAGFHPDLTGRENIYLNAAILGLTEDEIDYYFDDIIEFSGIPEFIDTQVKFYSSGMYVRLAFAVAVHVNPDVLIIDEVLAVGDEPFQRKCLDRVRRFQEEGKTIILVSHSLEQVGELCNRVVVLERGTIQYDGEPGEGLRVLRERFERERLAHSESPESINIPLLGFGAVVLTSRKPLTKKDSIEIKPGDSLDFSVTVTSRERIEDCVVGIGIETPLGHNVYGTNTHLLQVDLPAFDKEITVNFSLPKLQLGEGMYFLHASAGTTRFGELTRIPQAAHFSVIGEGSSIGSAHVAATAKITKKQNSSIRSTRNEKIAK